MATLSHDRVGQTKDPTQTTVRQPQTYVVDDPSSTRTQPTSNTNIEDRLSQFGIEVEPEEVAYALPPKKPISETLEKLIFIGRISKEIEISGIKFEISTLTNKEHYEIIQTMYSFTDPADLFTIRVLTLSNCLRKIDGTPINSIDIDGDFKDGLHKRMSIIDNLQLSVVERLYDEYEALVKVEKAATEKDKEIKN